MTDATLNTVSPIVAPAKRKTGIFQFVINTIRDLNQARITRDELNRLDDRALADMGIRRHEIAFLARNGYLPGDGARD